MTDCDWELYFAIQEGRDDLVTIELDVEDVPERTWHEINLAAYLLGHSPAEFLERVIHELLETRRVWPGGYGGSHNSITGVEENPCFVCGSPTVFVDVNFEAHICGGICEWAVWEAYAMALAGNNPWPVRRAA